MKIKNKYFRPGRAKRANWYGIMAIMFMVITMSLPVIEMYHISVPRIIYVVVTTLFTANISCWILTNDKAFFPEPKKYEQQYTDVNKRIVHLLETSKVHANKDYNLVFCLVGLDPETMSEIVTEYRLPTVDEVVRISYALGNNNFGDRGMLTIFAYLISGEETWLTDTGQKIDKELLNEYVTKYEAEHRVLYKKMIAKIHTRKSEGESSC